MPTRKTRTARSDLTLPLALAGGCMLVLALALLLSGALSNEPAPAPGLVAASHATPTVMTGTAGSLPTIMPATEAPSPGNGQPAPALTPTQTLDPAKPLAGRRIGLDPGHGPRGDAGAVLVDPNTGKLVLTEAELNLDVALRCRDLLVARGASVTLTRETPDAFTAPWPPDTNGDGTQKDQYDDLQERIDILNAAHVEVFLSIHANSSGDPSTRQGIQVLYCGTSDCAFPVQNKRLGALVLDNLQADLDKAGVSVIKSELRSDLWPDAPGEAPTHLFMTGPVNPPRHVRATQMPGVVAEPLYVTSPEEAAQLNKDNVRQAIAEAYADALQQYLTTNAGQ